MEYNIEQLDYGSLGLSDYNQERIKYLQRAYEPSDTIKDETLLAVFFPTDIPLGDGTYRAVVAFSRDDEPGKRPGSTLVKKIKDEFRSFLCTDSEDYEKERSSLGSNINTVVTGVASAIATKLGSIELGVITSIITTLMISVGKIGINVVCKSL